ncbi:hypothetical protein K505DRAFT_51467 [Melanomma pulvis-pyrius CBS 109.77]|uniref:Uncharacterized protein n=1 Tax=Melanomma pulvis-pyrius CBS 109.77 TaxID=1314802 RepID=A0A6A6X8D9_9PLEO|nr:hypothetical protein K505DRAFT_51467 [Melanomma pulvis-pyrius CBS 109.77]
MTGLACPPPYSVAPQPTNQPTHQPKPPFPPSQNFHTLERYSAPCGPSAPDIKKAAPPANLHFRLCAAEVIVSRVTCLLVFSRGLPSVVDLPERTYCIIDRIHFAGASVLSLQWRLRWKRVEHTFFFGCARELCGLGASMCGPR